MSSFLLEIVTPERKVYAEEVNIVVVKGTEGEMGILGQSYSDGYAFEDCGQLKLRRDRAEEVLRFMADL